MANTITGTSQNDNLLGSTGDEIINALGGFDTITDYGGNDKLYGNGGNDRLFGGTGADLLDGGAGNDQLDGGAGTDTLAGGAGDDLYFIDGSGDTITEAAGEGTDTVRSTISYTLGANLEVLVLLGKAANATGNDEDNTITGTALANVLDGGKGADTMSGGGGADIYYVDNVGDKVIEAGRGTDLVIASTDFTLADNVENLTLTGAAIAGTGNALKNVLTGTDADNVLDGGAGRDTLIGGAGNDTYRVDIASDKVVELAGGGIDTVESSAFSFALGAHTENLTLRDGAVRGLGNSLDNVLTGNAAANVLDGRGGADTMAGGAGNDTYYVDRTGDTVIETADGGSDTVYARTNYVLGANVEDLVLVGSARSGTGNDQANTITGNDLGNVLDGRGGDDTLVGGLGDDTYVVDSTGDVVVELAGQGNDTLVTSIGGYMGDSMENMTLVGGALSGDGNDLANHIIGSDGSNRIDGGDGDDLIEGRGGNDTLIGNYGFDTLLGGAGDDILYDSIQADTLKGGTDNDTYRIFEDSNTIIVENAGEGTDTVEAAMPWTLGDNIENGVAIGNDPLHGNALDNVLKVVSDQFGYLFGGDGNDTLIGGRGADSLHGEGGADRFVMLAAADSGTTQLFPDEIFDFSAAQGDKIDLSAIDANGGAAGEGRFRFIGAFDGTAGALIVVAKSGNWEVSADINGDKLADMKILVHSATALVASDFVL